MGVTARMVCSEDFRTVMREYPSRMTVRTHSAALLQPVVLPLADQSRSIDYEKYTDRPEKYTDRPRVQVGASPQ